jgi:pre-mRNA-splicing helicase BRR2
LTELLELPPSSADAFEHPLYMKLYEGRINHFNRIQTQVFKALYESDDNILVAAPTGNGKTLCAEFAILRNHRENRPVMSVVYIAPSEALAKERFCD